MKLDKQYIFIKNLNRLLKKGNSLDEAILLMTPIHTSILMKIKRHLENGESLSFIFKKLKFKQFVYEMIQIGEISHQLHEVIGLIEEQFDFYLNLKKQLNKVLLYPIILFVFSIICFEMIRIYLYPVITQILSDHMVKQNQLLLLIAFHSLKYIACIFIVALIFVKLFKSLSNYIPCMKMFRSLQISKTLIILLTCGNSLEEALETLKTSLPPSIYFIDEFRNHLLIDKRLPTSSPYTKSFIHYFKLGVKSNDLLSTLDDYRVIYNEIIFDHLTKLTYYIQFGLFTLLSTNLFLIYYLVMIPLLQISNNI